MKNFLIRLSLAVAAILVTSLMTSAHAQQITSPTLQEPSAQTQTAAEASANDVQTQDALAFSGQVVKKNGQILLNDPVTKMSYRLDDKSKAKPYVGKQVKVTGKLELSNNTIHIDRIEPLS